MDAATLAREFPWIPWREPVIVRLTDSEFVGLGCRICIALDGLRGADVTLLPALRADFDAHMREAHPE